MDQLLELVPLVRRMRKSQEICCWTEAQSRERVESVGAVDAWLAAYDAHEAVRATSKDCLHVREEK